MISASDNNEWQTERVSDGGSMTAVSGGGSGESGCGEFDSERLRLRDFDIERERFFFFFLAVKKVFM